MTTNNAPNLIIRTERGLTIAGSRMTLYAFLDYVHAGWPPKLMQDRLSLTNEQVQAALAYIAVNAAEVQEEYQQVLRDAEASRQYWEEQQHDQIAAIAARPVPPEQAAVRAKLAAVRADLMP